MFTGIVTSLGEIEAISGDHDLTIRISSDYRPETIALGASIACSGCCLTVTDSGAHDRGAWFTADVSAETLSKTVLGDWKVGRRINLERSLKVGDELGGHIVTGHVDGVGEIVNLANDGESLRVSIKAPDGLAPYIAAKGSIAMDGASLTVNEVDGATFGVNLIPHTRQVTTFGELSEGQKINLEIDVLARYVKRMRDMEN